MIPTAIVDHFEPLYLGS